MTEIAEPHSSDFLAHIIDQPIHISHGILATSQHTHFLILGVFLFMTRTHDCKQKTHSKLDSSLEKGSRNWAFGPPRPGSCRAFVDLGKRSLGTGLSNGAITSTVPSAYFFPPRQDRLTPPCSARSLSSAKQATTLVAQCSITLQFAQYGKHSSTKPGLQQPVLRRSI